jgi:hypothetical protein
LIVWLAVYLFGARGWQRTIALAMVVIDFLGAVTMFTADTLLNTGRAGLTAALTQNQIQNAVLALSLIIALNVAAAVAYHLTDPDKLREQAEEEAFDKVEDATLKQIAKNADQLAAQVAPMLAQDWMQNSRARYLAHLGNGQVPALEAGKKPGKQADSADWQAWLSSFQTGSKNGRTPETAYSAETDFLSGELDE